MPFSESFSGSFNKQVSVQPPDIGALTSQFRVIQGGRSVAVFLEEFNGVMGEWKIGDF